MIVPYTVLINKNLLVLVKASSPCVGPEAVFRMGPIRFLAGWHKRQPEVG